mmetsp:Transcript_12370/g.18548  ORF Transcript_12370/g.18548 Transcript_12370/m.18548 type:complete len:203 (-) Transcript_12370:41-649(-)
MSTPRSAAVRASIFFFFAFMMFGRVAYRGSFKRRSAVTTAGRGSSSFWIPVSISLVTLSPPSTTISEANVACGQSMRLASIWPVAFVSSSIACLPTMTRSGFSFSTRALKTFATFRGSIAVGSSPPAPGSTWIARSQPIARAVRSCSCEAFPPTVTAMISFTTFFSLSRTASSTAISQKGFMLIFALKSTPDLSGLTRILTA